MARKKKSNVYHAMRFIHPTSFGDPSVSLEAVALPSIARPGETLYILRFEAQGGETDPSSDTAFAAISVFLSEQGLADFVKRMQALTVKYQNEWTGGK